MAGEWIPLDCNLGIYANRTMRGSENLSVHATGWACDIGYTDRKVAVAAFDWLIAHTKELRIAEIHDYAYKDPKQTKAWGRGYRCSRGEGVKGIKIWCMLWWIHHESKLCKILRTIIIYA